jgi:hypothetical protein
MNVKKTLPSKPYTKNYPKRANKNQSSIVKKGYKRQQERLRDATVYTKTETVKRICDIWKTFLGRSGNRKLIKHDINLYKSIMQYGSEFDNCLTIKSFSAYLTLAGKCRYNINREYFCKCGSRIVWDATIQELKKKGYCKKCHITPNKKDHFKYKYGENWQSYYDDYHQSQHMQEIYKEKGMRLVKDKIGRGVTGFINKGVRETKILDYYEKLWEINIDRDFKVLKYFPDGYCHETNTIYEVYEYHHLFPNAVEKDKMRQAAIQDKLNCNFVIIYDSREHSIEDLSIDTHENY